MVYSVPELGDKYSDLGPHIRSFKKRSEALSVYLDLVRKYKHEKDFKPYEKDFSKLEVQASDLLEHSKKLSYLSMDYNFNGDKQSLNSIRGILTSGLDSLDEVIAGVEKILSDLHATSNTKFEEQKPLCESSAQLHKIYRRTSHCIDLKDYSCVHEIFR